MENGFNEVMSRKSSEELKKILSLKDDYQPEAVIAAELELGQRSKLNEDNELDFDDEYDFDYLKKIKALSDGDLLEIFEIQYPDLKFNEFKILNTELAKRSIEPKSWYYINEDDKKYGPFTSTELKKLVVDEVVRSNNYIWKNGLKYWIEAKDIDGLFDTANQSDEKIKVTGINIFDKKISSIC